MRRSEEQSMHAPLQRRQKDPSPWQEQRRRVCVTEVGSFVSSSQITVQKSGQKLVGKRQTRDGRLS